MAKPDPFDAVRMLFHFTDRRNLPSIQKSGGLYSLAKLRKKGVEILAPGGNELSHDLDEAGGLDKYVHLCFRSNHPMEHNARVDGRITDSIFLQIHTDVLYLDGVRFTDDVSNKAGVKTQSIEEARKFIDFEVLYTRTNWSEPEIQRRLQQAERNEVLVPNHIPIKLIRNIPNG
jgi:ssDNA thymidine ADP-ribosyltransferase DarT-like protein